MQDISIIKVEELRKNIVNAINNSNLPLVLLDYIIKDLYNEIHAVVSGQDEAINSLKQQ